MGAGTLELSGTNQYTGNTTVSAGKLRISNATGSALGTSAVLVSGGSTTTLSGTGIATGATTVNNASRLAPGINVSGTNTNFGAAGTLSLGTVGGMTLSNAHLDFDLANTAVTAGGNVNDLIATKGNLTLNSTDAFTFNELNGNLLTGLAYTLISGAVSSSNTDAITLAAIAANTQFIGTTYTPTFSLAAGTNTLQVTFAAVPEPSTWAMMFGGLGMFLAYQRTQKPRRTNR